MQRTSAPLKFFGSSGIRPAVPSSTYRPVTASVASASVPRHSGVEVGSRDGTQLRASVHNVTFQTPSGAHLIHVQKGTNLYNAADISGLNLPASCKQGSCSSCVGKVLDGRVTHSHDPACLTPSLKAQGYVALCCASVVGDATILTHQGAKLRAARALQLDRMRHRHG